LNTKLIFESKLGVMGWGGVS